MKLFPALLAGTLFLGAAPALADANNANGNGCRNRCHGADTSITNENSHNTNTHENNYTTDNGHNRNNENSYNDYSMRSNNNDYNSNYTEDSHNDERDATVGGNGNAVDGDYAGGNQSNNSSFNQAQQEGGMINTQTLNSNNRTNNGTINRGANAGGSNRNNNRNTSRAQGGNSRATGGRSNANNRNSVNVNTGGNSYTTYGDLPEAAVAPLGQSAGRGQIGDIAVPLPTISAGGFASGSNYNDIYGAGNNNRSDYGVSIGINIPLGAGEFRDAARREIRRRDDLAQAQADRNLFRLVQEAQWLQQQGLLSQEAHPRHYAALYGNK